MTSPAANDDGPGAIDTHCHLFLIDEDPSAVVRSATTAGVGRLICVGVDPQTSERSAELARQLPEVFATAGMHPHTASDFDSEAKSAIEALLADPRVVGVGETGLDYYRTLSPPEDQRRTLRVHIALSRESAKPLVIHVRDAWDDALAILADERADRVVLHCFSGDEAVAREATQRGYFMSFAGNVTYPSAGSLRRVASVVPEDRILCETDSPFLSPQRFRGRPNTPANMVATLEVLAEARGVSAREMADVTARASRAAFSLGE